MTKSFIFLKAGLFLFLTLLCNQLFAQNTLKEAWQAFLENNRSEAKTLFTQAALQKETGGEALLGLSFIAGQEGNTAESFNYFKRFFAQSNDAQPYLFAL